MATIVEPQREIPVIADVDVCVVGGGPGGLPAALAAARRGAKTLLLEMQGCLGGMATTGHIGPILGITASRADEATVGGIPRELCERMAEIGEARSWEQSLKAHAVAFNVEGLKIVADRMVREAGVELLLHALFVDSIVENGRMTHAVVESKSGRQAVRAKVFVDATGDADLAFRAGAACTKGRPADGKAMAMGSMFRIGGVATLTADVRTAVLDKTREAVRAGELNLYSVQLGGFGSTIRDGEATVNCTRTEGDCTNVRDLTEAEQSIRELTWRTIELWRSVRGAEGLHLISTPAHVGLRESRQVVGERRITGEDVVQARKYEDAVARCGYWIDIHCPRGLVGGGDVHLCSVNCKNRDCYMITDYADQLPDELYPPDGEWFDIPYRTLVPEKVDGVLVSGRCISADHQAMAALRVMGPCMAIGEAAGTAAALAAQASIQPREVDVQALRAALTEAGALV